MEGVDENALAPSKPLRHGELRPRDDHGKRTGIRGGIAMMCAVCGSLRS